MEKKKKKKKKTKKRKKKHKKKRHKESPWVILGMAWEPFGKCCEPKASIAIRYFSSVSPSENHPNQLIQGGSPAETNFGGYHPH